MDKFIKSFPESRYIRLRGMEDQSAKEILQKLPKLKDLNMYACWHISPKGIEAIAENTQDLQTLTLNCLKCDLTDAFIDSLARRSPCLKSLSFAQSEVISNEALFKLFKKFPNLEELDFSLCKFITSETVEALANACPRLKKLNIESVFTDTGENIAPESLQKLAKACPELEELNLSNRTKSVDDETIFCFAEHCKKLKKINLQRCSNLSEDAIISLIKASPKLTNLHISEINDITNRTLEVLAEHCKELACVNLDKIYTITEPSIFKLATECQRLHNMSLYNVDFDVSERLTSIKGLRIWFTPNFNAITPGFLDELD